MKNKATLTSPELSKPREETDSEYHNRIMDDLLRGHWNGDGGITKEFPKRRQVIDMPPTEDYPIYKRREDD